MADLEALVATLTTTAEEQRQIGEALSREHAERKRSDRLVKIGTVFAAVLAVIDLACLGLILNNQQSGSERGKRIEQSTKETHQTAVRLDCAFAGQTATPDTSVEGRQAAINAFQACVERDGKPPAQP